ncbi:MAG: ABC transporter ATP-binding protein [Oscillospiraceae bacterium]|nr:ABC transporter ATP-binding protein [Oscillospiraceae bacterium]
MSAVLELDRLTKHYPGFCLDGLTLTVPSGTIMGLIGENGAGKTTTINLMIHAIEKDGGEIRIFGKDNIICEKELKQSIGMVQDTCNLPLMFTISDIETVMGRIYADWDREQFRALVQRFDLPAGQELWTFSKGMKVKLNFAIALAHHSRLLLLDEATSGLDPVMRDEILDLLLDFVQDEGNSVLLSTHITSDLEKIADYVAFLHEGKLLFCKPKDELVYHYGIVHCGAEQFANMDKKDIVAWRKQDYEHQVLVADRAGIARKYPGYLIDPAALDDIMLLYIKGERT